MSKATWMAEFYPVEAAEVPKNRAAEHSLQKWRGYSAENLRKHDMLGFPVSQHADGCALCFASFDANGVVDCNRCVLNEVRRNRDCSERMLDEERSPWHMRYIDNGAAMVFWLEKAAALEKQRREAEVTANSVVTTLQEEPK